MYATRRAGQKGLKTRRIGISEDPLHREGISIGAAPKGRNVGRNLRIASARKWRPLTEAVTLPLSIQRQAEMRTQCMRAATLTSAVTIRFIGAPASNISCAHIMTPPVSNQRANRANQIKLTAVRRGSIQASAWLAIFTTAFLRGELNLIESAKSIYSQLCCVEGTTKSYCGILEIHQRT